MTTIDRSIDLTDASADPAGSAIVATDVSAWFGSHKVLERISLDMPAQQVTALIGPSG